MDKKAKYIIKYKYKFEYDRIIVCHTDSINYGNWFFIYHNLLLIYKII